MYRIVVTTDAATGYGRHPDGAVAVFDHILEAEAFAELWYLGRAHVRSVTITKESWPQHAARARENIGLGLPPPIRGAGG